MASLLKRIGLIQMTKKENMNLMLPWQSSSKRAPGTPEPVGTPHLVRKDDESSDLSFGSLAKGGPTNDLVLKLLRRVEGLARDLRNLAQKVEVQVGEIVGLENRQTG